MFLLKRWTIDTKYYSANLSIWMAHLGDEFSFSSISVSKQLDALVMVFDLSDVSITSPHPFFSLCKSFGFYEKFRILSSYSLQMFCSDLMRMSLQILPILCSYHLLPPFKSGFLALIFRSLKYYYALGTKQIFCLVTLFIQSIEDAYKNVGNCLVILIQNTWIMEFLKLRAVVCWGMKNNHRRSGDYAWNGAVNTTLNTLKLVHPTRTLINVRFYCASSQP